MKPRVRMKLVLEWRLVSQLFNFSVNALPTLKLKLSHEFYKLLALKNI